LPASEEDWGATYQGGEVYITDRTYDSLVNSALNSAYTEYSFKAAMECIGVHELTDYKGVNEEGGSKTYFTHEENLTAEKAYILEKVSELKAEFDKSDIEADKIKYLASANEYSGRQQQIIAEEAAEAFSIAEHLGIPENNETVIAYKANLAIYTDALGLFGTFFPSIADNSPVDSSPAISKDELLSQMESFNSKVEKELIPALSAVGVVFNDDGSINTKLSSEPVSKIRES